MAEIEMFLSLFSLIVGGKLLLCRAKVRLSHTQPPPPPPLIGVSGVPRIIDLSGSMLWIWTRRKHGRIVVE
jgi:hypothetical protein